MGIDEAVMALLCHDRYQLAQCLRKEMHSTDCEDCDRRVRERKSNAHERVALGRNGNQR